MNNDDLVKGVENSTTFLSPPHVDGTSILTAMRKIDRAHFIPDLSDVELGLEDRLYFGMHYGAGITMSSEIAYVDIPLAIGHDQTCSQPSLVAYMTKLLDVQVGMRVLEIGTGCGYQAAILGEIVGSEGSVTSIEFEWELAVLGQNNLSRHFKERYGPCVRAYHGDGSLGWKREAPYDRILLTAGVSMQGSFTVDILAQQAPDGVIVYPHHVGPIIRVDCKDGRAVQQGNYTQAMFVPLRGRNS